MQAITKQTLNALTTKYVPLHAFRSLGILEFTESHYLPTVNNGEFSNHFQMWDDRGIRIIPESASPVDVEMENDHQFSYKIKTYFQVRFPSGTI